MKLAALVVVLAQGLWAVETVERPKLLWEGDLHGIQDLVIHGNRVDVEAQSGAELSHVCYRFLQKLPELDLQATVHLLVSRGYVHIVQQPEFKNGYVLRVRIEDRQDGIYHYRLAISWPDVDINGQRSLRSLGEKPKKRKRPEREGESWTLNDKVEKIACRRIWQGDIEGTVQLEISESGAKVISGKAEGELESQGEQKPFEHAKEVGVMSFSRDIVTRILEPPGPGNNYTFKIEVTGGDGPAAIELAW